MNHKYVKENVTSSSYEQERYLKNPLRTGHISRPGTLDAGMEESVTRDVDGGVTATGVLSRERGNLITISITLY